MFGSELVSRVDYSSVRSTTVFPEPKLGKPSSHIQLGEKCAVEFWRDAGVPRNPPQNGKDTTCRKVRQAEETH